MFFSLLGHWRRTKCFSCHMDWKSIHFLQDVISLWLFFVFPHGVTRFPSKLLKQPFHFEGHNFLTPQLCSVNISRRLYKRILTGKAMVSLLSVSSLISILTERFLISIDCLFSCAFVKGKEIRMSSQIIQSTVLFPTWKEEYGGGGAIFESLLSKPVASYRMWSGKKSQIFPYEERKGFIYSLILLFI